MSELTASLNATLAADVRDCIYYSHRWYSTAELNKDTRVIRALLAEHGVKKGDRVLLGYPNSYAFAATYLAILEYGGIVAPFNPHLKPSELEAFLLRSRATIGFFHASLEGMLRDLSANRGQPDQVALRVAFLTDDLCRGVPESVWHIGGTTMPSRLSEPQGDVRVMSNADSDAPSDEDAAVLMYTSGTTGRPKAVALKHRHLLAAARQIIDAHELTARDVSYCFLPLFHINAQMVAVLSTWLSGGRIVIAPRFSASQFWPTVLEHRVTWVSAVPTVISMLQNADGPQTPPHSLRFVRSASAQLPHLVAWRFERRFGIPIIQSYGMTEAASQICVNPLPPAERRPDSVGLPAGVELRIVDDAGNFLPPGVVGEVVLRGPSVVDRYEEADNQDDFRDGWFHTGDMGRVDGDGYVYLTGRRKELINRAGEKVSPYEVEDVIREIEGVDQVAVIGLPDGLYGEQVAAYVVLCGITQTDQTRLAADIMAHCQESLSKYKWPSVIEFVVQLPVGPTGKIQRTYLKQQVLSTLIS